MRSGTIKVPRRRRDRYSYERSGWNLPHRSTLQCPRARDVGVPGDCICPRRAHPAIARDYDIDITADRVTHHARRVDSNRVLATAANSLTATVLPG